MVCGTAVADRHVIPGGAAAFSHHHSRHRPLPVPAFPCGIAKIDATVRRGAPGDRIQTTRVKIRETREPTRAVGKRIKPFASPVLRS